MKIQICVIFYNAGVCEGDQDPCENGATCVPQYTRKGREPIAVCVCTADYKGKRCTDGKELYYHDRHIPEIIMFYEVVALSIYKNPSLLSA